MKLGHCARNDPIHAFEAQCLDEVKKHISTLQTCDVGVSAQHISVSSPIIG